MTRTQTITLLRSLTVGALIFVLGSGCAFIEAASEQTLGAAQDIPAISLVGNDALFWPKIDDLVGMTEAQLNELGQAGFPTSLADGTFRHLQGALQLSGECQLQESLPEAAGGAATDQITDMSIEVVSCTDDTCTDVEQCQDFRGMYFAANVTVQLFTPEKAEEIKESLAIVPEEALVQLRFQVAKLKFFRETCDNNLNCEPGYECCPSGDRAGHCTLEGLCEPQDCTSAADCGAGNQCCGGTECAPIDAYTIPDPRPDAGPDARIDKTCDHITDNGWIHNSLDDFQLKLGIGDGEKVLVIDHPYLEDISESDPQRFDVDINSEFIETLKQNLFGDADGNNQLALTVTLAMRIAQPDLYDVTFDGAGLEITIQPEIVVSVVEVVKDQI